MSMQRRVHVSRCFVRVKLGESDGTTAGNLAETALLEISSVTFASLRQFAAEFQG